MVLQCAFVDSCITCITTEKWRRMSRHDTSASTQPFARVTRWVQRVGSFDRTQPWLLDAGLALAVFASSGISDLISRQPSRDFPGTIHPPLPIMAVTLAGLLLPLLWRRRYPTAAFCAVAGVFSVHWLFGYGMESDYALLIALFNLALHSPLRHLRWALPLAVAAVGIMVVHYASHITLLGGVFLTFSAVVAPTALALTVRLWRSQVESLRERATQLELERDQRNRLAAANERTNIAREMHDVLGHSLSIIITLADGGASACATDPKRGEQALRLIGDTGRRALRDVRRVVGVLREADETAERAPQPDISAIAGLCARIRAAGPSIVFRSAGSLQTLDPELQFATYRIVQEAFTNSLRHAGTSTQIELGIRFETGIVSISVRDSGPGRRVISGAAALPDDSGHGQGLAGIRERTALFHGSMTAGPQPDGGWLTTATLHAAQSKPDTAAETAQHGSPR